MIKRIRQFWRAIKAKLTVEDKVFIDKYLNDEEQKLFFAMRVYDQRHVLNVAYTAKKIIEQNQYENIDYNLLIRACLLHDVGRTAKDICLMDKVTSVLLGKFLPQKSKQWANRAEKLKLNKEKSFWQKRRYALYIYYNHAQLGAEKLNELGLNDIAEIIRYHHEKVDCKACGELQILCLADSLN